MSTVRLHYTLEQTQTAGDTTADWSFLLYSLSITFEWTGVSKHLTHLFISQALLIHNFLQLLLPETTAQLITGYSTEQSFSALLHSYHFHITKTFCTKNAINQSGRGYDYTVLCHNRKWPLLGVILTEATSWWTKTNKVGCPCTSHQVQLCCEFSG